MSANARLSKREEAFRRLEEMAAAAAEKKKTANHDGGGGEQKKQQPQDEPPDNANNNITSLDTIRPAAPSSCERVAFQLVDWTVATRSHLRQCENYEYPHHWVSPTQTHTQKGSPIVLLFGTTDVGHSISLAVEGFRPYFDVELPTSLETSDRGYHTEVTPELIQKTLLDTAFKEEQEHNEDLIRVSTRSSHRVFGFKFDNRGNPLKMRWVRISCETVSVWKRALREVRGRQFTSQIIRSSGGYGKCGRSDLVIAGDKLTFEQMFGNLTDIVPSGWVSATGLRPETSSSLKTQLRFRCLISNSKPLDRADVAPLVCASFDIECVPTTGTAFRAQKEREIFWPRSASVSVSWGAVLCGAA